MQCLYTIVQSCIPVRTSVELQCIAGPAEVMMTKSRGARPVIRSPGPHIHSSARAVLPPLLHCVASLGPLASHKVLRGSATFYFVRQFFSPPCVHSRTFQYFLPPPLRPSSHAHCSASALLRCSERSGINSDFPRNSLQKALLLSLSMFSL